MTDEMADPVIPPEAREAAAKRYWDMNGEDRGWDGLSSVEQDQMRFEAREVLEAALPHLRPLVETQELRLATEVALKLGRKLGRKEAAEEIQAMLRAHGIRVEITDARDTGKGNSA